MAHIHLLGTSHIAEQSINEIKAAFEKYKPDIVAVELDAARLQGLIEKRKPSYNPAMIKQIGMQGYLFALIGGFLQQKLGKLVGVKPGSEMLSAVNLAGEQNKKIFLIDRDVRSTLSRISKLVRWKERFRILSDALFGPFGKKMKIDLKKVPEQKFIKELIGTMRVRYPGLYKALIEERNSYMAHRLLVIAKTFPDSNILAVVGAGHLEGLKEALSKNIYKPNN